MQTFCLLYIGFGRQIGIDQKDYELLVLYFLYLYFLNSVWLCTFTAHLNLIMPLSNNDIFKKLRVALKLRDEDIVHICSLVDFKVTKSEIGAIFRSEDHPKYMECGDQFLRNFLNGLVIYKRGPMPKKEEKK